LDFCKISDNFALPREQLYLLMAKTDEDFLIALSAGNTQAFDFLFLKYQPMLLYFIDGFIKDTEQSRDICQDIFIKIWQNREDCGKIMSFKSYLYQMARHAIFNYVEHQMVNNKFIGHELTKPIETGNTEEQLFANQLQEMIDLLVSKMPEQRQRVYRMSREQGLKNSEIAAELAISKRTVENHITAALAEIRKLTKLMIILFT